MKYHQFKLFLSSVLLFAATLLAIGWLQSSAPVAQAKSVEMVATAPLAESAEANIANIPTAFSYQGSLRLADGSLATGSYNVTLKLYNTVTGGTALHSETYTNTVVRNGNFSVIVGDAKPISPTLFDNTNLYIGITVAPDPEMLPRQRLFPVPWAMQAGIANTAQTANQLLNNTTTNLVINRGATDSTALQIVSSAATYGAGMTMSNLTGNVTFGMYVGSDGAWHFWNTGGNVELLKFPNADGGAYFAGTVHAPGFNGTCYTNPIMWTSFSAIYCNQDVAETFATDQRSEPGDLMVLIPEDRTVPAVRRATQSDSGALVGVVSTNPGLVFDEGKSYFAGDNSHLITNNKTVVAIAGRVPTKFSLENGPIAAGDPLTSSSKPGVAMKATEAGQIIGYALQSSNQAKDGKLLVWLQVGTYVPREALNMINEMMAARAPKTVAKTSESSTNLAIAGMQAVK
ncbi:MAG: hypothetical protein U0175_22545 [Caldilineaceae bacterium]